MSSFTFTDVDIQYNLPAGVVGTLNGNIIKVGDVAKTGDTIKIECGANKKIRVINGSPFCYFQHEGTGAIQQRFIVSGDLKTATLTMADVDIVYGQLAVAYDTIVVEVGYTIKQTDLDNIYNGGGKLYIKGVAAVVGSVINYGDIVRFDALSGREFYMYALDRLTNIPSAYFAGRTSSGGVHQTVNFTLSENKLSVNGVLNKPSSGTFNSIVVKTNAVVLPADYVITQADITKLNDSGVVLKVNDVVAIVGTGIRVGDNLIATAGNGLEFYEIVVSQFVKYSSIYFSGRSGSGQVINLGFTLSSDNKTASLVFNKPVTSWTASSVISLTKQVTSVIGSNNVYSINDEQLKEVNNKRFVLQGNPPTLLDYGQYILSVIQLPCKLPNEYILDSEKIRLANVSIDVSANVVSTDNIRIDLGEIFTPKTNNNFLDYSNTVALLHLPRTDAITIDLEYVINKTLQIEYILDCYTGLATVNIKSKESDLVILTRKVDIGINIPMANSQTSQSVDNSNISIGGDNGIRTPFIEIVRNESVLKDGFFTIPVIDESNLSSASGYVRVEDVNLIGDTMLNEKESIISKLKSGVIFK